MHISHKIRRFDCLSFLKVFDDFCGHFLIPYNLVFIHCLPPFKVKNPSPEGPALVCPQRGAWIKNKGVLECWSIGVMEKAFPGI
jgi:hypothetical protein